MITVVSGLPRSGTSMMMQMLSAGGMEVLTDNIRQADENNQRGYFEYEKVKKLDKNNAWLDDARGKAVKIVSQFLQFLPPQHQYKIIFMERDLGEVLRSQEKMLENLGTQEHGGNSDILKLAFQKHLNSVKQRLARQPNMDVFYADHKAIINNPKEQAKLIVNFLNIDLDGLKMAAIVDTSLYRQRKQ